MADFPLLNNETYFLRLVDRDVNGDIVPAAQGNLWTVTAGNPNSLQAALGAMPVGSAFAGDPAVVATPVVQRSDSTNGGGGLVINITDANGLPVSGVPTFSIGPNLAPASIGIDLNSVATAPQPVPAAPGP